MPAVRSVTVGPDTLTVVTQKGTFTFTRADIPPAVLTQPIATIEANVNARLATAPQLDGMQCVVHIFQVNPVLLWKVLCANVGVTIDANWWDIK